MGKSVIGTRIQWCWWQVPARGGQTRVGALGRAPSPGTMAPFPQDRWIYFLADYRKRDRPAAAVHGGHRVAFAVVVIVVMVLLAKLIA